MNAERLHSIAISVRKELETEAQNFNELASALSRLSAQPDDADSQRRVGAQRQKLTDFLEKSVAKSFSPIWQESLEEFGLARLMSDQVREAVDRIFEQDQATPAVIHDKIVALKDEVTRASQAINNLLSAFTLLSIGSEQLNPGECELGFLIPRKAVENRLDELGSEFQELNEILAPFAELATGSRPPFEVRSIAASDFGVFVAASLTVASTVAVGVQSIISSYKDLLEIRHLRNGMTERGLPPAALEKVDDHANGIMEKAVAKTVDMLLKEYGGRLESGRKHEMKVELTLSLNEIANRIDEGYNIEVRAEPPSTGDDTENAAAADEHFAIIGAAQESLKFIHQDGNPMLRLPTRAKETEPHTDSESEQEKLPRKHKLPRAGKPSPRQKKKKPGKRASK